MMSKIRMSLAGLTAVALLGSAALSTPAMAWHKRSHKSSKSHKSSSIVQVSKGGDARTGNGGSGGEGGDGGSAVNTGGSTTVVSPGLNADQVACLGGVFTRFATGNPATIPGPGPVTGTPLGAAITGCAGAAAGAAINACLDAAFTGTPPVVTGGAFARCLTVVPPITTTTPGGGGGAVSSGGAGGAGAASGNAQGGNAGNNTISDGSIHVSTNH
jgi:hypothetical protein